MPCHFQHKNYRCDLGFADAELESHLCPLHIDPNEKIAFQESRREYVQGALDRMFGRRANDKRPMRLVGIVLPKGVRFGERSIRNLTLQYSHFGGGDHFVGTKFEGDTTIETSSFRELCSFAGSHFTGAFRMNSEVRGLDFTNSVFDEDALLNVSDSHSKEQLSFDKIVCNKGFTFEPSENCSSAIVLTNGTFRGRFRIKGDLRNGLDLSRSNFCEKASIDGWIRGPLLARECTFASKAAFGQTAFEGVVDFSKSIFRSEAVFASRYSNYARFEDCTFVGKADFSSPIDKDDDARNFQAIGFTGSRFLAPVLFTNRAFHSTTNFQDCVFEVAPEFHGATLHQDTRFPKIAAFRQLDSENAAASYRTLRQAMEGNNARSEEAMFYALEQKTLRRIRGAQSRWENFASLAYEFVSGYGVNFWRPLALLVVVVVFFGITYSIWLSLPIGVGSSFDLNRFVSGQTFSFQQVVNPFWVWRIDDNRLWSTYADAIRIVATFESLLTTGLFALSLLALRWRFKRE
jgi:hypothetical protein